MFSFTKLVRLTIGRAEKATAKVMPLTSAVVENPVTFSQSNNHWQG
jgi:hypothetical protein